MRQLVTVFGPTSTNSW